MPDFERRVARPLRRSLELVGVPVRIAIAVTTLAIAIATWPHRPTTEPDGAIIAATAGCAGCHTVIGGVERGVGPDLTRLAEVAPSRVDGLTADEYVRQSIREPSAFIVDGYAPVMPKIDLTEDQLDAVVTFLLEPS